jgi:hypothetical protein
VHSQGKIWTAYSRRVGYLLLSLNNKPVIFRPDLRRWGAKNLGTSSSVRLLDNYGDLAEKVAELVSAFAKWWPGM